MENKLLSKRLKSYSALAGSVLGMAATGNATIVYTDIVDAVRTGNGAFYDLDLNNDATLDYKISIVTGAGYAYVKIDRQGTNDVSGNAFDGNATAHSANAPIDNTLVWNMYNMNYLAIVSSSSSQGQWIGVTNKYLGLQLHVGPNIYYGWARLDVNSSATSFTIKDYAFNNVANQQILAGQGAVGIDEHTANPNVSIAAIGNVVHVNFTESATGSGTLSVTDLLGHEVRTMNIQSASTQIDLSSLNGGIYFITIREEKFITTEKVLISN